MTRKTQTMMIMAKPNLVERNEFAVKQHPQDDDANQLSEENPCVKKHVRAAGVGVEIKMIILTE
jgi:hypothetical protein